MSVTSPPDESDFRSVGSHHDTPENGATASNGGDGRMTQILNFRDVGVFVNQNLKNAVLRPSQIFRSARPDETSATDRSNLREVHKIRSIVDLRSDTELIQQAQKHEARVHNERPSTLSDAGALDATSVPGIRYLHINLNGGAFSRALLWRLGWSSFFKFFALMAGGYRVEAISILGREVIGPRGLAGLAIDSLNYSKEEIRSIFEVLANESNLPALIHCTQGKDRTGLIVILLLSLLNVPVSAIEADYRASEPALEVEDNSRLKELHSLGLPDNFKDCPQDLVQRVLAHVKGQFGGTEAYLMSCGIRPDSMKAIKGALLQKRDGVPSSSETVT